MIYKMVYILCDIPKTSYLKFHPHVCLLSITIQTKNLSAKFGETLKVVIVSVNRMEANVLNSRLFQQLW